MSLRFGVCFGAVMAVAAGALISVSTDEACGAFLGAFPVSSPDAGCFDLPANATLGSKEAVLTTDTLGTCAPSGGSLSGEIEEVGAMTLCCEAERPAPL